VLIDRRTLFSLALAGGFTAWRGDHLAGQATAADPALEGRIRAVIEEFGDQGFHRTGTLVDERSGNWLSDNVARMGLEPLKEPFALNRIEAIDARLSVGGTSLEGLPLFDGGFTGAEGLSGRLGPVGGTTEIGLVVAAPNTAAAGALGEARRGNKHRAIVCVTRGARPGLCLNNADAFLKPFGPPVLQVSSEHTAFLEEHAAKSAAVQLFAAVRRVPASAFNVVTTVKGSGGEAPLVIMTPRSGWYSCASERGGGIACWLEVMRMFREARPQRDVVFVASSGHELGHLGIDAFIERRPAIVTRAVGWMHFGANIGAATRPPNAAAPLGNDPDRRHADAVLGGGIRIQASDDEREALISRELAAANLAVATRTPRGTVPGGEAENVHRGGGRYVSVIGTNGLFHHPDDRGIHTVNVPAVAAFVSALSKVARAFIAG
jgi:hypothetical protein